MNLGQTLRDNPPPMVGVEISNQGRGSPYVQYALACLLASRYVPAETGGAEDRAAEDAFKAALGAILRLIEIAPNPRLGLLSSLERMRGGQAQEESLRLALRALRPVTELGPSAWSALDPSLEHLRNDPSTKKAFFRMIQGPGPVLEYGKLAVVPQGPSDPVTVTVELIALPITERPPADPGIDVEIGVGDAYTDYKAWKPWLPMPLAEVAGTHLKYERLVKPAKAEMSWVVARCRIHDKDPWRYIGAPEFDLTDPTKMGTARPAPLGP
jgi:hypothetical protein